MVGQVHHHAHVVLDHQHRHAPFGAHVENEARHVLGLLAVHAGDGLVEHQHLGLHGQRARHLDALLQAVGQGRDRRMADMVDLEKIDDALLDVGAQRGFLAARAAQVEQRVEHIGLEMRVATQLDVVEHGHAAKQRDVLEAAAQAQLGALRRMHLADVLAFEQDAALGGAVEARDGVEQRGLARAIRADHGGDGAGLNGKAHAIERLHAAKRQRDAVDLQQGGSRAACGVCLHRPSSAGLCEPDSGQACVDFLLTSRILVGDLRTRHWDFPATHGNTDEPFLALR